MPDGPTDNPISDDLRYAFEVAAKSLENWGRGDREPSILHDRINYPIGAICNFVMDFSGRTPDHIYECVLTLAQHFRSGDERHVGYPCDSPKDQSYASVARCLLGLYNARVARYQRKDAQDAQRT
jgi:hypothetical protein